MFSGQNYQKSCFLSLLKTQKMQKTLFSHFLENAKNAKNDVFCIFLKTQKLQKKSFLQIRKNNTFQAQLLIAPTTTPIDQSNNTVFLSFSTCQHQIHLCKKIFLKQHRVNCSVIGLGPSMATALQPKARLGLRLSCKLHRGKREKHKKIVFGTQDFPRTSERP